MIQREERRNLRISNDLGSAELLNDNPQRVTFIFPQGVSFETDDAGNKKLLTINFNNEPDADVILRGMLDWITTVRAERHHDVEARS